MKKNKKRLKKIILIGLVFLVIIESIIILFPNKDIKSILYPIEKNIYKKDLEQQLQTRDQLLDIYNNKKHINTEDEIINKHIQEEILKKRKKVINKINKRSEEKKDLYIHIVQIPKDSKKIDLNNLDHKKYILDKINDIRIKNNKNKLLENEELNQVAQKHAEYMANSKDFAHTTTKGQTFEERVESIIGIYKNLGENIANGNANPQDIIEGRISSIPHQKNILNDNYDTTGIGFKNGYRVQIFGQKK